MKKLLISFFICILVGFYFLPAHSQVNFPLDQNLADSLEKLLPSASGKDKVDILNGISYALIRHYSSRSDSLSSISVQMAEEMGYKEGLAKALFCKGTNDYVNGKFIDAMTILYEALDLYKDIADTNMIIETYYQIGAVSYFSFTDLKEGLHCVQICLDYAKASGYKHWESQMYSSFQYLYSTSGDHDNAFKYLKMYSSSAREMAVPRLEEAMVIAAYGRTYFNRGEYRRALDQYLMTWPRINPDDIEERAYLAQLTYLIGSAYSALGISDSAFYYFNLGMELSRRNIHNWGSMVNSLGLARQYLASGDLTRSVLYGDSAIYFGSQIDSSRSFYGIKEYSRLLGMSGELYIPLNTEYKRFIAWKIMAGAYQIILRISEQQGSFQKALQVNRQLNKINDSIDNFQKRTEILDLQYKYQSRQKDDQIQLLSQENQLQSFKISQNRLTLVGGAAFVLLAMLTLLLFIRQSRLKANEQLTELKQKLFRSQMNPHFIFNSLTSIQNFIINQDDIKASIYLSRFSELVRSILTNSIEERITLDEEIGTIRNYLELQKVRFSDKFDYSVEVDERIDPENTFIPPMLGQPFIENSIEHGIKNKDSKGHIWIRFIAKNGNICYSIEDDGVGRKKAQEVLRSKNREHKSLATEITRERIRVLNRRQKKKLIMEILDLKSPDGQAAGTRVTFTVARPYHLPTA